MSKQLLPNMTTLVSKSHQLWKHYLFLQGNAVSWSGGGSDANTRTGGCVWCDAQRSAQFYIHWTGHAYPRQCTAHPYPC